MPEMKGTAFLDKARDRRPDTMRIVLTDNADLEASISAINQGNVYRFISKPWDNNELKMTITPLIIMNYYSKIGDCLN